MTNENIFKRGFLELINNIQFMLNPDKNTEICTKSFKKICLFHPYTHYKNINSSSYIQAIQNLNSCIKDTNNFTSFISLVRSFCDFILYAEIALFLVNDDNQCIYAEVIEDKKIIYFKDELFKLKICFEKTKIPRMDINLIDDILSSDESSTKVEFIYIDIAREYGKKISNHSKYVFGEDIIMESEDSHIMFSIVCNKFISTILNTYNSILEKSIGDYLNIKTIKLNELIYDGLYVKKEK